MLFYPILSPEFPPGPASLQGPPSVNRLTSAKSAFISASERNKIQVRWVRWVRATGKLSLVMYRHVADLGWYMGDIMSPLEWNCGGFVSEMVPGWDGWNPKGAGTEFQTMPWKVEKVGQRANPPPLRSSCLLCPARPTTIHRCPNFTSAFPGFLEWWRYSKIGSNPWGFSSVGMEVWRT